MGEKGGGGLPGGNYPVPQALAIAVQHHQAVLALRVMQDLSYDEIATTLRIPPGTVMSRLSRARAELKKLLRE